MMPNPDTTKRQYASHDLAQRQNPGMALHNQNMVYWRIIIAAALARPRIHSLARPGSGVTRDSTRPASSSSRVSVTTDDSESN